MNQLSQDFPPDDVGRRSRFAPYTGMRERAASQPPRDADNFYGSLPRKFEGPFGEQPLSPPLSTAPRMPSTERWAHSRLGRSPGLARAIPIRSASFSASDGTSNNGSVISTSHFPSTFEDDEEEVTYEADLDTVYDPIASRSRGYDPSSRSRSQSLAVFNRSSGLPAPGSGMAQSWRDNTLSTSPLNYGNERYNSDLLSSTRYSSVDSRMTASMYASSPTMIPFSHSQTQKKTNAADISNMSPFVRDVNQILLDDGATFRDLWGAMPQRDEGGGGSGTTSRRHSVSIVQPRRGVVGGFAAGGVDGDDIPAPTAFGSGRLMISDEDLASDLNTLNLNFHENGRHHSSNIPGSQPASLPIYGMPNHPHHSARDVSRSPERNGNRNNYHLLGLNPHPRGSSFTSSSQLSDIDRNSSRSPNRGTSPFRGNGEGHDNFFGNGSYRTTEQRASYVKTDPGNFAPLASPSGTQSLRHGLQHLTSSQPSVLSSSPTYPQTRHSLYGGSPLSSPVSARGLSQAQVQPPSQHQQLPIYQPRRLSEPPATSTPPALSELGRGVPLHSVPESCPLFIVEFKAARTDIYYCADPGLNIRTGDLVIVEADRGKDLGKVINDTITLAQVEAYQKQKVVFMDPQHSPTGGASKKDISPKRIYAKAQPQETQLLLSKMQDEQKALQLCQSKVRQKKLPMEVVDAEYQWDRRKLTFYFIAEKRIDFRELVRELFRLYKTRIWMACLQGPAAAE